MSDEEEAPPSYEEEEQRDDEEQEDSNTEGSGEGEGMSLSFSCDRFEYVMLSTSSFFKNIFLILNHGNESVYLLHVGYHLDTINLFC